MLKMYMEISIRYMDNSAITPLPTDIHLSKNNLKYLLEEVLNCFSRMVFIHLNFSLSF